jgi:hypothetical protein
MVITKEMPVSGIVDIWDETREVFSKYNVPFDSNKALKEHVHGEKLNDMIIDLNQLIGSSTETCTEGG